MRNTFRHGDTMIAVESQPATIAFDEILKATEVVADEYESMTPWEHCDGFEQSLPRSAASGTRPTPAKCKAASTAMGTASAW